MIKKIKYPLPNGECVAMLYEERDNKPYQSISVKTTEDKIQQTFNKL